MTPAALLAVLLASSPTSDLPLKVSVEGGSVAAAVAAGLAREVPEAIVVREPTGASLRVRADSDETELELSVKTRGGSVLLSRRIPRNANDPRPALRVAVLLLAKTVRAFSEAELDGARERPADALPPVSEVPRPVAPATETNDVSRQPAEAATPSTEPPCPLTRSDRRRSSVRRRTAPP